MAVTRIKNNQITDLTVNAAAKLLDYSITSGKIANNLVYGSDLTVSGNLTVQGNVTSIDSHDLVVEDPIILLAKDQVGSPSLDIGFIGARGTELNIGFVWDESNSEFATIYTSDYLTNTTVTINSYADLRVANLTAVDANITGNITFSGNILGNFSVTGNLSAGNLIAIANIDGNNINATELITANAANITNDIYIGGNIDAPNSIFQGLTGIFLGDDPTGNNALYAGVANYTPLGSDHVVQFSGNVNAYSQVNFQNINAGNLASTDYVATADDGDDDNYYVNLGINSSTYDDPVDYPGFYAHDSYLHNHGGNLILNPETTGTYIKLMVGGTDTSNVVAAVSETGIEVTGYVSATGNVTAANIIANGVVDTTTVVASGNITAANVIANSGLYGNTLDITGDALISGNLTVQGNLTYINIDDLRVEDPIIMLGTGPNGNVLTTNDGKDRGTELVYYSTTNTQQQAAFMGWINSSANMVLASNVTVANDVVTIVEYGTLEAGNAWLETANVSGNVTVANLNANTNVTTTTLTATANVNANNAVITSDVSTATVTASGNILAANVNANTNVTTTTLTATANVNANNAVITSDVSTATVTASGNVLAANVNANSFVTASDIDASGNIIGNIVQANTQANIGNIVISGNDITSTDGIVVINNAGADVDFRVASDNNANMLVVDAGSDAVIVGSATVTSGASLKIGTTDSLLLPVGNTAQRPASPVQGMIRFNTTINDLEYYDNDSWNQTKEDITIVTADSFNGDGSTVAFVLSQDATTASVIVSINGVVQIPTTAYSVSGNVLTFTEPPEASDFIDARLLTTTTDVVRISNTPANAIVAVDELVANVDITGEYTNISGNVIAQGNITADYYNGTVVFSVLGFQKDSDVTGTGNVTFNTTPYFSQGSSFGTLDGTGVFTFSQAGVYQVNVAYNVSADPDAWGGINGLAGDRYNQANGSQLKNSVTDIISVAANDTYTWQVNNSVTVYGTGNTKTRIQFMRIG
jgi:hypothetical protein